MITIEKLGFAYDKKTILFKNLSIRLMPGTITGLLGANGAGKTTLLKLIAGSLSASSGQLDIIGFKPFGRQVNFLQDMYFIPEEFYLPAVRISGYLKAYAGFYPNFDHLLFGRVLEDFHLAVSDRLHKLSHGQRKKFLIAFALATKCRLLIFDEPTNGLDIPSKSLFRKALAGNIEDHQIVIISTHQVKDVENLIDNIVVLKDGKVAFHQPVDVISEKLIFSTSRSLSEDEVLYYEAVPEGYKMIQKQLNGSSSGIDIELLFNAINLGEKLINEEHE